ncbi:MAG: pyridoxamine 5'-phosphate oxidase family protein [Alphaproteobacteria bacterium]|nr:MAG: pyridoxamine 5'-phosphate oxidase family protein [Alphaproteobacteria bacterium]
MDVFSEITDKIAQFIDGQQMFFVATAAGDGHINLSPKGLDTFRRIDAHTVAYLDYVGSGNETAAHLLADGRITIMFCGFDGPANIVRLYGTGEAIQPGDAEFAPLKALFPDNERLRQIMRIKVTRVQASCGYGVPLMTYDKDRETLVKWTARKSDEEYAAYQQDKNLTSIDGLPTGL